MEALEEAFILVLDRRQKLQTAERARRRNRLVDESGTKSAKAAAYGR
jgi:hypothetical protein